MNDFLSHRWLKTVMAVVRKIRVIVRKIDIDFLALLEIYSEKEADKKGTAFKILNSRPIAPILYYPVNLLLV